jgi:hypothetical protein
MLKSLQTAIQKVAELLKEENVEEAVATLEETAVKVDEAIVEEDKEPEVEGESEDDADAGAEAESEDEPEAEEESPTEIEKLQKTVDDQAETIAKFADLYVSSESVASLVSELKSLTENVSSIQSSVEDNKAMIEKIGNEEVQSGQPTDEEEKIQKTSEAMGDLGNSLLGL